MKAYVTSISKKMLSRYDGHYYMLYFKDWDSGKSYTTYIYPKWNGMPVRNFHRWKPIIEDVLNGVTVLLDNLSFKRQGLIDADSDFTRICAPKYTRPQETPSDTNFEQGRLFLQEAIASLSQKGTLTHA